MFGNFGNTSGFGSSFSQNSLANKPATSTFPSTGTSLFGAPANTGGFSSTASSTNVFGQPQTSTTSNIFGGGFNQPKPATANIFGATQTSNMFGQPNRLQGAGTGSMFSGTNTATISPFSSTGQTQPTGTSVPFNPITGSDTMMRNGVASPISTRNQCITCMKEYENKSLEELRLEDYQLGRKGPSQTNVFGGNQPQPSTGLFSMGQQSTGTASAFGQTTSAFGGPATTGSGGLFSLNQQKQQSSFFSTPGTTTSAFGGTTPFSFTNTTSQPGSLFGTSTAPATGGFGSSFGVTQTSQQQQPNMSIFGSKPAVSAPFGSFNTPTSTAINKPPLFGGGTSTSFGTVTSSAPFAQTTAPLFSATTQQQNKPFSFSSSFGSQTTQPTFGSTGTFAFNPPANQSLNFNTGSTFGTSGTTGGGFPSFGTNTTTNFGSSLTNTGFGANTFSTLGNAPGSTGMSLFNTPSTLGTTAPNLSVSGAPVPFGTTPYKDSPLFYNLITNRSIEDMTKPTNPVAQRQIREASRRKTSTSLNASNGNMIKSLTFPAPKSHLLLKDPFFDGFEEEDQGTSIDILSPKTSVKKLTLKNLRGFSRFSVNNSSFNVSATEDSAASEDAAGNVSNLNDSYANNTSNNISNTSVSELFIHRGPQVDATGLNDSSSSESPSDSFYAAVNNQNVNGNCTFSESYEKGNDSAPDQTNEIDGALSHPCGVKSTRVGYYISPQIKELDLLTDAQGNCFVRGFIVGRHNYGEIRFLDVVNVANLDIDETVLFRHKEVVVYPDDSNKPPVGEGINVPAEIRLERVWPIDKTTKDPIKVPSKVKALKYEEKLKRSCSRLGAEFVSYDEQTGLWVFRVTHFSKYSCAPEEEEEDDEITGADVPKGGGLGGKTIEQLKTFIGPTQALIIEEDADGRPREPQKFVLQDMVPSVPDVDIRGPDKDYPGGGGDQYSSEQVMNGAGMIIEKIGDPDSSLFPASTAGGDMDLFDIEEDKMNNFPDYFGLTDVGKQSVPDSAPPSTFTKLPSVRVPQHRKRDEISFIDATKKQTKFFKLQRFPQSNYKQGSRVSFGPSGTYVRVINKSKDYPRANRFIGQAKVEKLTPHREYWNRENNFFEFYSSLTTKQLVLMMDNSCPDNLYKLRPDGIIGELIKVFSEDEELQKTPGAHPGGKYHFVNTCKEEHQLWLLCSILWPSQELTEAEQNDKGFLIEYRVRLADWFKTNAAMLFGDQYDAKDDTLKGLLKKGLHLEACELAVEQGNFNLALNLAQCCGESQKAMELQMEEWENQGMLEFIPKDVLEMYRLCSGLPIWDDIDIKQMSTSEWLQHFAIYLWYICPMHFSIEEAVMHYQASIIKYAQGDYDVEYPSRLDSSIANTCIHLLKAYVSVGYNVKNILNPKTNNPDCLDYKLSWFLMQNLKQFGYAPDPELIEDLTVGFAGQLESMGMFHWAIYVLKTLPETVPRNVMIDRILERNITFKPDQEKSVEFIETLLKIPRSHIQAHFYRY